MIKCLRNCFYGDSDDDNEELRPPSFLDTLDLRGYQRSRSRSRSTSTSSSYITSMEYESRKRTKAKNMKRFSSNEEGAITELYLNNCGIEEVPSYIYQKESITDLWLCENLIFNLDKEICKLENLASVWLNRNLFETLPLLPRNIKNVSISFNPLVSLKGIGEYSGLRKLDVSCCQLVELPHEIGMLKNLQSLAAHDNHLTHIPDTIGKLEALGKMSLHSNSLKALPSTFGNLTSLKWLSLHFNKFENLPTSFSNLSQLQRLSLHHNALTELRRGFEKCCINLLALSLFRNKLRYVDPLIYKALTQCTKLSIQQNRLEELPIDMKNMEKLEELWCYDNNFETLPAFLNDLPSLKLIYKGNHPFINSNKNIKVKS
jgi:Leucine-rich repeat (LRR) protein